MTSLKRALFHLTWATFLMSCSPSQKGEGDWEMLFDGSDLGQWDTYLGPVHKPGLTWDSVKTHQAIGLNNDTAKVFSIIELGGENVLRISGEYFGGISTKREFENTHLQLQFKWGQLKWYPRDKDTDKRDSGLLYYGVGEHGDGDGFWLRSQEFQIQEGDCGDYWGVAGAMSDITARLNEDSIHQYDPKASLLPFSSNNENGRFCKKYPDGEKPYGEWNTLDLYTFNGTSMHVVNGTLTMVLQNSRLMEGNEEASLTMGKIQLQSEAAEIFYRNIKIRKIESLPELNLN